MVLLLFLSLVFLSACSKTDVIDTENEDPLDIIVPENEGDEMQDNGCSSNKQINLNQTDTLTSLDLWTNSNVCDNLVHKDGYIQLNDLKEKGTLETESFLSSIFLVN